MGEANGRVTINRRGAPSCSKVWWHSRRSSQAQDQRSSMSTKAMGMVRQDPHRHGRSKRGDRQGGTSSRAWGPTGRGFGAR